MALESPSAGSGSPPSAGGDAGGAGPNPVVPVLDYPVFLERCMGKVDLASRLLVRFLECGESDIERIAAAVAAGDAASVIAGAHKLKGASANLSAERLRAEAAALESLGRGNDLGSAADLVERCRTELRLLAESVREHVSGISSGGSSRITGDPPGAGPSAR